MANGILYKLAFNTCKLIFSESFSVQIMNELIVSRANFSKQNKRKKYADKTELKVNIGCGASGKLGWENIDAMKSNGVTCIWNCSQSLPFDDNSVRLAFSEHFVEHIDYYADAPLLFKDIFRVLKPGGIARIIVPCGEKYLSAYNSQDWKDMEHVRPLPDNHVDPYSQVKMHTKMEMINWVFRQNYEHKFMYDFETMKHMLMIAGFKNVVKQDFNISLNSELLIDIASRASESLYVEAVKE